MEEDIKILEEKLKQWEPYKNIKFKTDIELEIQKENRAIENLINRNKELEEDNYNLKTHIYNPKVVELNYIPKSKIKEKIKELQAKGRIKNKTFANCGDYIYQDKIQALQELLEE